jgi:hypothetical protein
MVSLAHTCLLTLLKSQPYNDSNPVVIDQVYDVQKYYTENKRQINVLRTRIKKAKNKVHSTSGLKTVELDFDNMETVIYELTHELFDVFNWNIVKTKKQAIWKEYFHSLYDLLVGDYDNDHPSNVILAREIVRYHDVLKEPVIDYSDKMYPHISNINDLFNKLKYEQVVISNNLKNVKHVLRDVQCELTDIQFRIIEYQTEMRKLEHENNMYSQIIKWSKEIIIN